jgi:hypothetical protein
MYIFCCCSTTWFAVGELPKPGDSSLDLEYAHRRQLIAEKLQAREEKALT